MATSIFEKNGQKIEVPTEALEKKMSDVSGGYVTGQTEQQRLESLGYKLLSPYSGEKVTDGSAEIRTDLNVMNNNINNLPGTGEYDFSQTNYLNDEQKNQLDQIKNFSMALTPQDEADIAAAGMAAGMKYDPLINEAKEEKRKGMPKAVISAGERGGFMSTQMAGVSALAQTEGGDWIGAGGELENIKSVYDVNIQNLETAKLRAIEEAKAAAKTAAMTGKREDRKAMMEAFEFAQNASLKQIQLANERVQAISNYNKLIADKKSTDLSKVAELATLGINLTPNLIAQIDSLYGSGYAQKYYEVSKRAKEAQSVEDSIALQKDVYELLAKVPVGKKIQIGDATYEGLGEDKNNQIFSESDVRGTTYVTVDKKTGEIVNTKFLSGVGATKPSSNTSINMASLDSDVANLLATKGEDGYINTEEYGELYDQYAAKGSKYVTEFIKRVTPEVYLNPNDSTAKKYLQSSSQALKSAEQDDGLSFLND